jgi:3-hydroxyisobutyrate dehydrogenase-like beta-hydroxyacid dehydrogenase
VIVGVLHPGEMGSALGAALVRNGHDVLWASEGRTDASRARAEAAGLRDVGTLDAVGRDADAIVSVCPPHAALDVARAIHGFDGVYVDANAVSPATVRRIAELQPRFVDGGIIGPPPHEAGTTRFYLSGEESSLVAELFAGSTVDARTTSDASALKMVYAAWSKGSGALLLAIREVARAYGVEEALVAEWRLSAPELLDRLPHAERAAAAKGWRWVGEMEEIADTFAAAGQPDGFHRAAAEVYRA